MAQIVILSMPGVLPSALAGVQDMFALGGLRLSESQHSLDPAYQQSWSPEILVASSDGADIIDGQGRYFAVSHGVSQISSCEAVIVPGFMPNQFGVPPEKLLDQPTCEWLRTQYRRGAIIAGSCSGVLALGEAGLLNGRQCTTTWWLHNELKSRFSNACPLWASGLLVDQNIVTAGGPLSWVDVTLQVIKMLAGDEVATKVADLAVVDSHPRSQTLHVPKGYQVSKEQFLVDAENVVRQYFGQQLSSQLLAKELSISERTLHRRLKQLTGQAPKQFIDSVRMEYARSLLLNPANKVSSVAQELGYSDDAVFRRVFKLHVGMSPSQFRQKYQKS
ncbi:GlxA family transcriptional regulator [Microbulbifer sp. EKSA005]|uniref:GlxA family transcriptional regulator n=1 Tax=Microbulbifer sp. EKSA005 TaxID=3243364 RepID=UPI0040433A7E